MLPAACRRNDFMRKRLRDIVLFRSSRNAPRRIDSIRAFSPDNIDGFVENARKSKSARVDLSIDIFMFKQKIKYYIEMREQFWYVIILLEIRSAKNIRIFQFSNEKKTCGCISM